MFFLDSLMISGLRWTLRTIQQAADAELNDESALRDRLIEAEMRREAGELSDAEYETVERDLLARLREVRERREGGAGPLVFTGIADAGDEGPRLHVEASVDGEFHDDAPPRVQTVARRARRPAARGPRRVRRDVAQPRSRRS